MWLPYLTLHKAFIHHVLSNSHAIANSFLSEKHENGSVLPSEEPQKQCSVHRAFRQEAFGHAPERLNFNSNSEINKAFSSCSCDTNHAPSLPLVLWIFC